MLYEFDLIYKALKEAIADYLAGLPLEDYEPVKTSFPDEELLAIEDYEGPKKYWKLYFNGALNSHGKGVPVALMTPKEVIIIRGFQL